MVLPVSTVMNIDDEYGEQNENEDIIGPIELNNNLIEEYIRKRKKELDNLQKTAQMIENTKEQMRRYVERQEERLEDIEEPEKKEDKKERKKWREWREWRKKSIIRIEWTNK